MIIGWRSHEQVLKNFVLDKNVRSWLGDLILSEKILSEINGKYHIKWKGYETTTWEPSENIPKFIKRPKFTQ